MLGILVQSHESVAASVDVAALARATRTKGRERCIFEVIVRSNLWLRGDRPLLSPLL